MIGNENLIYIITNISTFRRSNLYMSYSSRIRDMNNIVRTFIAYVIIIIIISHHEQYKNTNQKDR